jgi:hypothetical protein
MSRSYTVAEIDAMRRAIYWKVGNAKFSWPSGELDKAVEDRLRTYMLAGIDPTELCGTQGIAPEDAQAPGFGER